MPRLARPFLALLVTAAALLGLAGCGSGGDSAGDLPKVTGSFGSKPKVTATGKQSTQLESKVLHRGDGPEVKKGDLLVANYLGQTWRGNKVFDNSYDRGQPAGFQIGVGQVIKGWDQTLVGVPAGSRVELVIPPALGYGAQGNPQAGIKGDDTLVFVVDVIASYAKDAAETNATPVAEPAGLPKVTGALGKQPTVTVPKGTAPPAKGRAVVLARGTGPGITDGQLVVMEYQAVSWAGKPVDSTWGKAPQAFPAASGSPFASLVGVPVGSRVLLLLPPQQGGKPATDSLAVAIDVVAAHGPTTK